MTMKKAQAVASHQAGGMEENRDTDCLHNAYSLRLSALINQEVAAGSEIGQLIWRRWSAERTASNEEIAAVLSGAFAKVDSTTPILLVDRCIAEIHQPATFPGTEEGFLPTRIGQQEIAQEKLAGVATNVDAVMAANVTETAVPVVGMAGPPSLSGHRLQPILNRVLKPVSLIEEKVARKWKALELRADRQPRNLFYHYILKMKGGQSMPRADPPLEALFSFIATFIGIAVLTCLDFYLLAGTAVTLVIGSFGAMAVLLFCAIKSPLAQPRHAFLGHFLAAGVGVACQIVVGKQLPWLAAALSVAVSVALMSLTNTVHPPAGATALIAVYGGQKIRNLGFWYVLVPVCAGTAILTLVALLINNCFPSRRFPKYWF